MSHTCTVALTQSGDDTQLLQQTVSRTQSHTVTYQTRSHILPQLFIQNYTCRDRSSWIHKHTCCHTQIFIFTRGKWSNIITHTSYPQCLTNPYTIIHNYTCRDSDTQTYSFTPETVSGAQSHGNTQKSLSHPQPLT